MIGGRLAPPVSGDFEYYEFFNRDYRGKRVLDIGSGVGSFQKSKRFGPAWRRLQESDQFVSADLSAHEGVHLLADAHGLPFRGGCFDVVIANNLFEHLLDPKGALTEIQRVMKPGGHILFTVPFLYPVHEAPNDYLRPTRFGLELLLEGFDAVVIKERGRVFSILVRYVWLMFRHLRFGRVVEVVAYPVLWLVSRLDRFDRSGAFALILYGEARSTI